MLSLLGAWPQSADWSTAKHSALSLVSRINSVTRCRADHNSLHSYLTLSYYSQLLIPCQPAGKMSGVSSLFSDLVTCSSDLRMVRDTPSPGPRVGASPGPKRRAPRAKSLKRLLGPSLSPFQERLKETEFYTKPLVEKFDAMSSVRVGIIKYFLLIWEGQVIHVPTQIWNCHNWLHYAKHDDTISVYFSGSAPAY